MLRAGLCTWRATAGACGRARWCWKECHCCASFLEGAAGKSFFSETHIMDLSIIMDCNILLFIANSFLTFDRMFTGDHFRQREVRSQQNPHSIQRVCARYAVFFCFVFFAVLNSTLYIGMSCWRKINTYIKIRCTHAATHPYKHTRTPTHTCTPKNTHAHTHRRF